MENRSVSDAILIVCALMIGFSIGFLNFYPTNMILGKTISNNLNYSNLLDVAKVYTSDLNEFYKFNRSNIGKELTLEEFKENGGVCLHASEYYYNKSISDGITTRNVIIGHHMFNVIADNNISNNGSGIYCILDQTNYFCVDMNSINIYTNRRCNNG